MAPTLITNSDPTSSLSRRTFLQGIGAALGASATGVGGGLASSLLSPEAAMAAVGPTLPLGKPIVVVIELNGGNDILNTIIPVSVPWQTGYYRTARPTLGITRMNSTRPYPAPPVGDNLPPALALTNGWGMHGSLPWLANRWHTRKDVAIIQGVGENVKREMSHFASYAFHWAGAFTGPLLNTGWLGRYNDLANPAQPLGAVSLIGAHDSLNSMQSPSVAINSLTNFSFNVNNIPDSSVWLNQLSNMGDQASLAVNKAGTSAKALDNARMAMATANGIASLPSQGQGGSLAQQLTVIASLISAGVPCQTYVAGMGGFDDHGQEPANHTSNMAKLNAGLAHFDNLVGAGPRRNDIFIVIYSEFSRQIKQNGSQGSDHGLASSMILVGGGVKGGWYGQAPSLAPAARYNDSMVASTDFRSVYATILNRLGGSPALTETALGRDESSNSFADLGVFTTGPAVPLSSGSAAAASTLDDIAAGAASL
jgi:uncharacterized protein (DUF1501 family)